MLELLPKLKIEDEESMSVRLRAVEVATAASKHKGFEFDRPKFSILRGHQIKNV